MRRRRQKRAAELSTPVFYYCYRLLVLPEPALTCMDALVSGTASIQRCISISSLSLALSSLDAQRLVNIHATHGDWRFAVAWNLYVGDPEPPESAGWLYYAPSQYTIIQFPSRDATKR